MGDPHQSYLVARIPRKTEDGTVTGWTYICVAAIYHNMCSGVEPLRSIHRFVTLAKQTINAEIIREEIRLIGDSHWQLPKRIPSKYLGRLLSCAFNFGWEEDPPYCRGHCLAASVGGVNEPLWCFGNSEGISVIDITEPENCSYCLLPPLKTYESELIGTRYFLLDVEEYIRHVWCPEPETEEEESDEDGYTSPDWAAREAQHRREQEEQEDVEAMESLFKDVPYMNSDILCEAWPHHFPRRINFTSGRFPPCMDGSSQSKRKESKVNKPASESPSFTPFPRLGDLLLEPAVQYVLANDDIGGLEELMALLHTRPTMEQTVLTALRSPHALSAIPDTLIGNLAELLWNDWDQATLNLSYLPLTTEQILRMIERFPGIRTLKSSHNPLLTIETVRSILNGIPTLKRLVLLDTNITEKEWAILFRDHQKLFYNLESLVHPCLVDMSKPFYPAALTFCRRDSEWSHPNCATLPFFSNPLLVQTLTLCMNNVQSRRGSSGAADGILSAEPLKPGLKWAQRSIPFFAPPSHRPLKAEGWIFLLDTDYYHPRAQYGFVKPRVHKLPEDSKLTKACSVYDVMGFLRELEKEGRPKFSEEDKKTLKVLFENAKFYSSACRQGKVDSYHCFQLVSEEEARRLIFPTKAR